MLVIKIAELGSTVKEVALAEHQNSVGDALDAAGVEVGHRELRVGGQPATCSTKLQNGDLVTLVPQVKGGAKSFYTGGGETTPPLLDVI